MSTTVGATPSTPDPVDAANAGGWDTIEKVMVVAHVWRSYAWCSCGWVGRRRLMLAAARLDGWEHSAKVKHPPGNPFVWPAADR